MRTKKAKTFSSTASNGSSYKLCLALGVVSDELFSYLINRVLLSKALSCDRLPEEI